MVTEMHSSTPSWPIPWRCPHSGSASGAREVRLLLSLGSHDASGRDGVMKKSQLGEVVEGAWRSFGRAAVLGSAVTPAVPILFFGDVDAYFGSRLRVVTVGLNPSSREFPTDDPFRRFPLAEGIDCADVERYLDALSAYFRADPYAGWFGAWEPLLNGAGARYYPGAASTALHTDICSPVATDPTWSRLGGGDKRVLMGDGVPLWHELLVLLGPDLVLVSVARRHLERISFEAPGRRWEPIHTFNNKKPNGAPRKRPYRAEARWHVVGDEVSLFVFCPASQKPLGSISADQRRELGAVAADAFRDGR